MDSRVLLSAITCVDNEVKPSNTNSLRKRLQVIRELVNDPLVREILPRIDSREMKRINRAYYWGFRLQLPLLVYGVASWRHWATAANSWKPRPVVIGLLNEIFF